jgi:DNA-binding transcriptional regulator YiaG
LQQPWDSADRAHAAQFSKVENYQIADNDEFTHNSHISMIRVTGSQLAAGRVLASLSRQELAHRARLSYHSIRAWEHSSNSIPEATYSHLCRALDVLEAEGVVFVDGGVYLQRGTVLPSDDRPGRPAVLNNGAVA